MSIVLLLEPLAAEAQRRGGRGGGGATGGLGGFIALFGLGAWIAWLMYARQRWGSGYWLPAILVPFGAILLMLVLLDVLKSL